MLFPPESTTTDLLVTSFYAHAVRRSARKVGRMKGCRSKLQGISKPSRSVQTAYATRSQVRYHGK